LQKLDFCNKYNYTN
jgi:hypothetical protein